MADLQSCRDLHEDLSPLPSPNHDKARPSSCKKDQCLVREAEKRVDSSSWVRFAVERATAGNTDPSIRSNRCLLRQGHQGGCRPAEMHGADCMRTSFSSIASSSYPGLAGRRLASLRLSYLSRWSHPVSGPADSKTPPPQSLSAPQVGNRRKKHSEAHSPKTPTSGRDDELILYNGKAVLMPVRLRMGGNRPER